MINAKDKMTLDELNKLLEASRLMKPMQKEFIDSYKRITEYDNTIFDEWTNPDIDIKVCNVVYEFEKLSLAHKYQALNLCMKVLTAEKEQ